MTDSTTARLSAPLLPPRCRTHQLAPRESYGRCMWRVETGGTLVRDTRLAAGIILPRHEHTTAYVCVVLEGDYAERSRHETRCTVGSVLVHPAGHVHANVIGPAGARCVNIELDNGALRDGPLRAIALLLDGERHLPLPPASPVLRRFAQALDRGGEGVAGVQVDPLKELEVHAATLDLLCALARNASAPSPAHVARRAPPLSGVIDRLEADIATPPSIDTLAALAGLHPHHFMRVFRTHQGETVGAFVRRRRLERADAALHDPRDSRTLADIALDLGFCDQSHLTRAFRHQFGTTPARRRRTR